MRLAQVRDRSLGDEHEASHVDRQLAVDVLELRVLDAGRNADPRRVDEQVEAAVALDVLGDRTLAILRLGDIGCDGVGAELGGGRLDLFGRPRRQCQRESLVAQHPRDRQADPRRTPRDECRRQGFDYRRNVERNTR